MALGPILETTFVIDLEREAAAGPGPAHAFLRRHPDRPLYLTFTVDGELAAGPSLDDHHRVPKLEVVDYRRP